MASYSQFVFDRARIINLAGLTIGLATVLLYHDIDSLVLSPSSVPLATFIRFAVFSPLILASIYFCLKRQRRPFLVCSTLTVLAIIIWWYSILLIDSEDSLLALFAVTIQFTVFSSLLLHLPLKNQLLLIAATAIASLIAVLMSSHVEPAQRAIFGFGIAAVLVLTTHWCVSRDARYRALYQHFSLSTARIRSRNDWNAFLSQTVNSLRESTIQEIRELLIKSEANIPSSAFLKRAQESAREIANLMERFSQKTDWTEFINANIRAKYSVKSHLSGVVSELRLKSPSATIKLHIEEDFDSSIDRELLTRLIANLAENAIRFATPDTPIVISILKEDTITIDNTGPQLSKTLEELSQPGMQSEKPGRFGLGLYVCSKICKSNGINLAAINMTTGVRMQLQFSPLENTDNLTGMAN